MNDVTQKYVNILHLAWESPTLLWTFNLRMRAGETRNSLNACYICDGPSELKPLKYSWKLALRDSDPLQYRKIPVPGQVMIHFGQAAGIIFIFFY